MGVAGSLAHGPSGIVYLGGNMHVDNKWHLSIFKIDANLTSQQTKLVVTTDSGCLSTEWGHSDDNSAPYISHLGFMTDATIGDQIFGLTSSNNFDDSGHAQPYVFRILIDNLGKILTDYQFKRLELTEFLSDSYIMGMRPTMNKEGDYYYIHCIYANYVTKKAVYYMKVSPDGAPDGAYTYAHKITNE